MEHLEDSFVQEKFKEDDSKRPNIGALVVMVGEQKLWWEVVRRAYSHGHGLRCDHFRQPIICDLRVIIAEHDVLRLQVSVHNIAIVDIL